MSKKTIWVVGFFLVLILNFLFIINSQVAGLKKSDLCQNLAGCPDTSSRLCATIKLSAGGIYEVTLYCYEPELRN